MNLSIKNEQEIDDEQKQVLLEEDFVNMGYLTKEKMMSSL
jgi:hypothetical protein